MLMIGKLGPRSHQAHVPKEHIHQLGQFVQLVTAKNAPHLGDPAVAMPRDGKPLRLRLRFHGAEFVDGEQLPQAAYPLLAEDDRTGRTEPHCDRQDRQKRREQEQTEKRQDEIYSPA
jgi:hypothetical protein